MNPLNKHPNSLVAYCIEEVIGNNRTAADVSREKGITKQVIGRWIEKHWFGSRQYDNLEFRESKINQETE